jgi:hypothetical protein
VIESWIRRYPDQWLWIHRRWKTRPPASRAVWEMMHFKNQFRKGQKSCMTESFRRKRETDAGKAEETLGGKLVQGTPQQRSLE